MQMAVSEKYGRICRLFGKLRRATVPGTVKESSRQPAEMLKTA